MSGAVSGAVSVEQSGVGQYFPATRGKKLHKLNWQLNHRKIISDKFLACLEINDVSCFQKRADASRRRVTHEFCNDPKID